MVELLREGMDAGATGLSSGVFYATGAAADIDELRAARAASPATRAASTRRTSATRCDKVLDSLDEAFATGRRGSVPVVVSHHKCAGPRNWGRTRADARAHRRRAHAAADRRSTCYPYIAGSTVLRKRNGRRHHRHHGHVVDAASGDGRRACSPPSRGEWGCTQQEACERLQPGGACYFQMREDDVQRVLKYPATMIGSDGLPHDQHPHPRLWGTFPRVLGHYSRELGLFSLETAVHKMSGLSARQFRLEDRGEIREGAYADIVVFDAATVKDVATFEQPKALSLGIECVLVNGAIAYRFGDASQASAADGSAAERRETP